MSNTINRRSFFAATASVMAAMGGAPLARKAESSESFFDPNNKPYFHFTPQDMAQMQRSIDLLNSSRYWLAISRK